MSSGTKATSLSVSKGHRYHPFKQSTARAQLVQQSAYAATSHAQSDLLSSPLLDYLGYRFHKQHHIMICVACEFAVLPGSALGHVHNQHNISTTRDEKKYWDNLVKDWNVTSDTFILPPKDQQPVELLKIHPDAYCCNECNYGALTSRSFANHWTDRHQSSSHLSPEERYHRGHVQTFYQHVHCRYFQVNPPIPNSTPLFDVYMKAEVPSYESFDVTIPSAPREIPPLLYQTRWHEHLEMHIKDRSKRRTLMTLGHPTRHTKSPLWKLVWYYLTAVAQLAKSSSMRIRCLLQEYPR